MTNQGSGSAFVQVTPVEAKDESRRGVMLVRGLQAYIPCNAGIYVRISEDPYGLERGVGRQTEDCQHKGGALGWTIGKVYTENDTSAYQKKKTTLPDGTVVWRVDRPKWRAMLDDLYHGRIDGIIVYDQDRLLRQPRDLEDLIDIVEHVQRPVTGITSSINLLTSDGRAMARVMAAMALKSSEDTARRVARARLTESMEGKVRKQRRFGWTFDGEVIDEEAEVVKLAATTVLSTGSWAAATRALEESGVPPLSGRHWHIATIRNMLLSPGVAGIAVYRGIHREGGVAKRNAADRTTDAVKDAKGRYVMTGLPEILSVKQWEDVCAMAKAAHEGKTPTVAPVKKYLLSGLLRCANIREDGTVCGRAMIGTVTRRKREPDKDIVVYKCPGKAHGGCGRIQRNAVPLETLIEELLFIYLKSKAPRRPVVPTAPAKASKARRHLEELENRLADLRHRYNTGDASVTGETFYANEPVLIASIKAAKAEQAAEEPDVAPRFTADQVAAEWKDAKDAAVRRAILARYLHAIEVSPSAARGRAAFDHNAINPVWKELPKR